MKGISPTFMILIQNLDTSAYFSGVGLECGESEHWLLLLFVVDERRLKDGESSWSRKMMMFGVSLLKLSHIGLTIGA